MKKCTWLLLFLLCVVSISGAEQIFPVCAFHVKDSTWFADAGHDSLGLNTILWGDVSFTKEKNIALLNAADDYDFKVILGHARKGYGGINDIEWYCRFHWGQ